MAIRKSTFYIGFNDKDAHRQIFTDEKIIGIIDRVILRSYPNGATLTEARGIYRGEVEKSIKAEVLFSEEGADCAVMDELLKALNQESIAIQIEEVNSSLYYG